MDPLSDIIGLLRPHAAMAKPITGRGSWGVRYSAYGKPGFAIILEGGAWLALEQAEPVRLARGDFIILPATPAFALYSDPDAERLHIEPVHEAVRHGDPEGEPDFRSLGGSFEIERV